MVKKKYWSRWTEREPWIRACDAASHALVAGEPVHAVAAALKDARVAVMGGRARMPRSLGSVYAGSITRFLGSSFKGVLQRTIPIPAQSQSVHDVRETELRVLKVALNAAGTVLVALIDEVNYSDIDKVNVDHHDWSLQTIDFATATPLRRRFRNKWAHPFDLCVAPDGGIFVTVEEAVKGGMIYAFTPHLELAQPKPEFNVMGTYNHASCIAANDSVVVFVQYGSCDLVVLSRDGAFRGRRFALRDSPGWCPVRPAWSKMGFVTGDGHDDDARVAIARNNEARVCIVRIADGTVLRDMRFDLSGLPRVAPMGKCVINAIACSPFGELIMSSIAFNTMVVFTPDGKATATSHEPGRWQARSVALHPSGALLELRLDAMHVNVYV
jgi:hypothetical protein